jgi:heme a synthase
LCYTLWFAFDLLIPRDQRIIDRSLRTFILWITMLLVIQLTYGAFMAGLRAASFAPTWPDMNGTFLPASLYSQGNREFAGLSFLADNPLVVHFVHRNLAYIIAVLIFVWWWKARKINGTRLFNVSRHIPLVLVLLQVVLGIYTVLNPFHTKLFLWLGVSHQFVAMLLLLSMILLIYIIRSRET